MSANSNAPPVQLATLADAAQIAAISRDQIEQGLGWSWNVARVQRSIRDPDANVAVVRERDSIVAFGILFGATALAGQMLALVLKPTVSLFQLGIADQLLGAIFGLTKALVFIEVFLIVFVTYPRWGLDDTIDGSTFGSELIERSQAVVSILPDEFEAAVDDFKVERLS